MKSKEPEDIARARELLRKYEQTKDHQERTRFFEDAMDMLDQCIDDVDRDQKTTLLANNIRRTHTKKMLESIPSLYLLDIDDWFRYVFLLLKQESDLGSICMEYPLLKANFTKFINIWSEEAIKMLREIQKT